MRLGAIPKAPPLLAEAVHRLIAEFKPTAIYVFGSVGRGTAGPDSDVDLMFVVPSSSEPRYRRAIRAERALRGLKLATDVVVLTQEEFDRERQWVASLVSTVLREGTRLDAA